MEEHLERRAHWECQSIGVCDERHHTEEVRWGLVQKTLDRVDKGSQTLQKVGYSILGGLIVALVLLALNLNFEKQRMTLEGTSPTTRSSPLKTN